SIRRDQNGHFWVGGIQLEHSDTPDRRFDEAPMLRWLLRQRSIEIQDARVSWQDETGVLPAMHAPDVDLAARHGFLGLTQFSVQAKADPAPLRSIDLRGELRPALRMPLADEGRLEGRIYIELQDIDLALLGPWAG